MSRTEASTIQRMVAVAKRDFVVARSYHFGLIMQFVGIAATAGTFFFISELVGSAPALDDMEGGYFAFALVGLLLMSATFVALQTFSNSIASEQSNGTLETLLVTPTGLGTLLAGAFIVPVVFATIEAMLYLAIGAVLGLRLSITALFLALPLGLLTVASFAGFGVLAAAFIVLTKRGDPFSSLLGLATNFVAGAVFPVSLLPGFLQGVAKMVPAYYGLNGIRAVLLQGAGFGEVIDEILILLGFTLVLLPFSMWVLSRALRAARVTGTLGSY